MKVVKFIALDIGVDGIKLAEFARHGSGQLELLSLCLLYTSDAADE